MYNSTNAEDDWKDIAKRYLEQTTQGRSHPRRFNKTSRVLKIGFVGLLLFEF